MCPLAHEHRKFFRFLWQNRLFEFQCLPFWLSSAPRIFTKILRSLVASLRSESICLTSYIDDFLILVDSEDRCLRDTARVADRLTRPGFLLNEKSCIVPATKFNYLGVVVGTISLTFSLSSEKVDHCRTLLSAVTTEHAAKGRIRIRQVLLFSRSLLGQLNFAADFACPLGRVFLRDAEMQKFEALRQNGDDFDACMHLSESVLKDFCQSERAGLLRQCSSITMPTPKLTLRTDASSKGWGMQLLEHDVSCGGRWDESDEPLQARAVLLRVL
jgi:hypothetical protein